MNYDITIERPLDDKSKPNSQINHYLLFPSDLKYLDEKLERWNSFASTCSESTNSDFWSILQRGEKEIYVAKGNFM